MEMRLRLLTNVIEEGSLSVQLYLNVTMSSRKWAV